MSTQPKYFFILYNLTLAATFTVFQGAAASECTENWEDASDIGLGYLWFETSETMNYADAVTFCKDRDSRLIEIDSQEQLNFTMEKLLTISEDVAWQSFPEGVPWETPLQYKAWWGGATDTVEEGSWVWTQSGNPVQDFIWQSKQPNSKGGYQNYLCFEIKPSGDTPIGGNDFDHDSKNFPLCQQQM